ncbi:MAG: amidohydrolase, partial [Bacteroidales bacterium]|nr:amidohydrolase [Bacteroidales bacterium]
HNNWEIIEFPDNELLEKYFPEKKILLIRVDGHASVASKAALLAAGIDAKTKVAGGEVLLNKNGQPSGVLIDNADLAVKALVPKLTQAEKTTALLEAQEKCFAVGLSSVVDAGLPYQTIELIRDLQMDGQLKMKINAMIDPDDATLDFYLPGGKQFSERLSITAVKMYADGALGSRGAKLLQPYSDENNKTGLILHDNDFYQRISQRAYEAGFQVNMHAIGDSAVRFVLDLYSSNLKEKNDRRWRVEHAQVVHPEDFDTFEKYSIIPSIQSTHATSDMRWAIDRLGVERIKGAYAQQDLLAQNGWIINGTDFPIEGINPINTFFAAVFRKDETGYPEGGFQMENALSREQALRSMTIWAAKGTFEENIKGSIEPGKYADFVILDRDIMEVEEKLVPNTKVLTLYISGERVYRAE